MIDDQRCHIVEGIAAIVTTEAEMGLAQDEVRRHALGVESGCRSGPTTRAVSH
jgi:hypothetical protein